jgi:hypothetical protein
MPSANSSAGPSLDGDMLRKIITLDSPLSSPVTITQGDWAAPGLRGGENPNLR